jgi:nascent polypeptide-associated complex subunit alpha
MFPGMNPKQMQQAMKQLGIKQEDLDASEVIIRLRDREIVIKNPSVQKIKMQGQESYQIAGNSEERRLSSGSSSNDEEEDVIEVTEEDIETIMSQAKCSREQALEALELSDGDLAMAILMMANK